MFKRQTSGSVVCISCGKLVGVLDPECYHCGRRNPGLWGYAPLLRRLGADYGLIAFVMWTAGLIFLATIALSGRRIGAGAIIISGSVVTQDVPPGCVAAGVPARFLRRRNK